MTSKVGLTTLNPNSEIITGIETRSPRLAAVVTGKILFFFLLGSVTETEQGGSLFGKKDEKKKK